MLQIPKKIHVIWVGDEGKRPDAWIRTWSENHPAWEFKLWGNAECNGISWRCKRQLGLFRSRGAWDGVADIMRYEILHQHGGVYVDADSVSVRPLDESLLEYKMFAVWESEHHRPGQVASGFIGSIAGHPVLGELITRIENMNPLYRWSPAHLKIERVAPWESVGPKLFTDVVRGYPPDQVKILPSILFLPRHYEDLDERTNEVIYARHGWGTTLGLY